MKIYGLLRNRDEKMQRPMIHSNATKNCALCERCSISVIPFIRVKRSDTQHFQHAMHIAFLDRKQCDWSHFSCQIYNKLHDMTRFKNALAFIRICRAFGDEWKNFLIKPNSMETSCSSERMKSACNFRSLALLFLSLFPARSFSALF